MPKKPSFLERLTGSIKIDRSSDDGFDRDPLYEDNMLDEDNDLESGTHQDWHEEEIEEEDKEGELPIDMYQTRDEIVILAHVAGVNPENLDISITRDMVTLRGERREVQEVGDEDYYHRELFWGTFSRTIALPEEIIIDEAEAKEKHGFLEIRLPKLDKDRSTRLTVKPLSSGK